MKTEDMAYQEAIKRAGRLGGTRGARFLDGLRAGHRRAAELLVHSAFLLDKAGREAEAISRYKEALDMGLPENLRREAMICLASSLETVGNPQAAVKCLLKAKRQFADDQVIDLFLASAFQSTGAPSRAVAILASRMLDDAPSDALRGYASVLRRKLGTARVARLKA